MLDKLRGSLRSRTAWFAYTVMAAGLIEQATPFLASLIPEDFRGLAIWIAGGVVLFLRMLTKDPLEMK